ncbi:hypothetical protein IJN73_00390 [Candidatus Saccharibacteria bacterium]|nr:hypothetical protein [Candidatus Saccharibacteria bacterium]
MESPTIDQVIFAPWLILAIILSIVFILGIGCWAIGLHKRHNVRKDEETFTIAEENRQKQEELALQQRYAEETADRTRKNENLKKHQEGKL